MANNNTDEKILKPYLGKSSAGAKKPYRCLITDCNGQFATNRSNNYKRHMQMQHRSIFNKLFSHQLVKFNECEVEAAKAIDSAVEWTTIYGRPFTIFQDKPFKELMQSKIQRLKDHDFGIHIDRNNILTHISNKSDAIFNLIKDETKGRNVSVMIDIATKSTLSVMGINIQYIVDATIVNRSIGVIQLNERHEGKNLAEELHKFLEKYGITMQQVNAVTTDCAPNMFKAVKHMNGIVINEDEEDEEETVDGEPYSNDDYEIMCDVEFEQMMDIHEINQNTQEDIDEINLICEEAERYDNLLKHVAAVFAKKYNCRLDVHGIDCAAHTLQLAIKDALNESNANAIFLTIKDLCQIMRNKNVMIQIRAMKMKTILPPMDVVSRWNSTYVMVRDFIRIKKVIIELAKTDARFELEEQFWKDADAILQVLASPYFATKRMQKVQYTLSDFYGTWLRMRLELEQMTDEFAKLLLKAMEKRSESLLNVPALLCAVFLDPRFKRELTGNQRILAIETIKNIFKRLNEFKERANVQNVDILDRYLQRNKQDMLELLMKEISEYDKNAPQLASTHDILKFWKENENNYPMLFELAMIIMAISPTQTSVERSFSAFSFIFNRFRQRMSPEHLQKVLLIRLNKDLFYKYNESEIRKIVENYDAKKE